MLEERPTSNQPVASKIESSRPSILERLKSILGAIGKGAQSSEKMGIYHQPEPPQIGQEKPPAPEPSKP